MAKFKSLIVGNRFEQAERKLTCDHDSSHAIEKGAWHLNVRAGTRRTLYCLPCSKVMLKNAQTELKALGTEITSKS